MVALGFLAAIFWTVKIQSKNNKQFQQVLLDISTFGMIFTLIGSRIIYVLTNISYYLNDPLAIIKFYDGGLSLHGGFLGGLSGTLLFCKLKKQNFWQILNFYAPGVALGIAIGRIGCFLAGCCYGRESSLPWAIPNLILKDGIRRHPTQLYESFSCLIIFLILAFIVNRTKFKLHQFLILLSSYSFFRIIIEQFRRGPEPIGSSLPSPIYLTYAQIVSILIIIICLFLLLRKNENQ